jgi:ATP-dependent Zn protease
MTDDSDLRASAYQKVGHAIVAWSLGLEVQSISIRADDVDGGAAIGEADHLPLVDQIALTVAGHEAEHVFDSPTQKEPTSTISGGLFSC